MKELKFKTRENDINTKSGNGLYRDMFMDLAIFNGCVFDITEKVYEKGQKTFYDLHAGGRIISNITSMDMAYKQLLSAGVRNSWSEADELKQTQIMSKKEIVAKLEDIKIGNLYVREDDHYIFVFNINAVFPKGRGEHTEKSYLSSNVFQIWDKDKMTGKLVDGEAEWLWQDGFLRLPTSEERSIHEKK